NIGPGTFSVAGFSGRTKASSSAAMTGGTDDIIKVVSQADVDTAKQKIAELDNQPIQQELKSALIGRDLFAVGATFTSSAEAPALSVQVNEPADSLVVTQVVTYTMLGVKLDDLKKVIDKDTEDDIDTSKQSITDYGL